MRKRTSGTGPRRGFSGGRGGAAAGGPKGSARDACFRLLARREYSRKELHDLLLRRGHETAAIDEALAWLAEEGYQSDERYAVSMVRYKGRRQGGRRLRQDLARAGVGEEAATAAMAQAGSEVVRCVAVLRRHEGKTPDAAARARITRWLAGRGFDFDTIRKAWKVVFEGMEVEDFEA